MYNVGGIIFDKNWQIIGCDAKEYEKIVKKNKLKVEWNMLELLSIVRGLRVSKFSNILVSSFTMIHALILSVCPNSKLRGKGDEWN